MIEKLVGDGSDALAKYAFSSSYVPGQADESALERDATVGELAAFRHLLHEAHSMTGAELRWHVERQGMHLPRSLRSERGPIGSLASKLL